MSTSIQPFAVQPGEGAKLQGPTGDALYVTADTRNTGGSLTVLELVVSPKRGPALHTHLRFHRTMVEGWAFKKFYNSESARLAALPAWVHQYNHHRPHSAIGKRSPITRLNNLAGHHI